MQGLLEIDSTLLDKKTFKSCLYFFTISQLSPLGIGRGPSFEHTLYPLPMDSLCQVWLKWYSGSGEDKNVKSLQTYRRTDG